MFAKKRMFGTDKSIVVKKPIIKSKERVPKVGDVYTKRYLYEVLKIRFVNSFADTSTRLMVSVDQRGHTYTNRRGSNFYKRRS